MAVLTPPQPQTARRPAGLMLPAAVLCLCAIVLGLVGYGAPIPASVRPALRLLTPLLWLALAWLAGRQPALRPYRSPFLALFGVSAGIWLASLVGNLPARWLGLNPNTSLLGLAVGKVGEVLPIVAAILVVNRLDRGTLDGLLLRRGRLGLSLALGLAVGAVVFGVFLAMGGWAAVVEIGAARLLAASPLILVFVLANSFMEELWFRGSLLTRFEAVVGRGLALAATTLAFAALHSAVDYTSGLQLLQYLGGALVLGGGCGWVTLRTRTLWGAVLAHAIGDVCVVLGFFYTLM